MKKSFIAAVVLFCTTAVVCAAPGRTARRAASGGYRPAGTVAFANLDFIARTVSGIAGPKSNDPVLKKVVPDAIRGQAVARLFGAMRPKAHGVAVCYVDPVAAARVAAAKKPSGADLERAKRWCVVYPTALPRAAFLRQHPHAVPDAKGTLKLPPGRHSNRTFWVWFSPDGQWAVLAPSASMAAHAFGASAAARARPLGADLAHVRMDAAGARAVFGSALFADGELSVRMTAAGLELRAAARKVATRRPPLPAGALAFAGVPRNAPLFGVTTTPSDVQTAEDIFAMFGPAFGIFVKKSLLLLNRPGATSYYLADASAPPAAAPRARLLKILPEAQALPATANALFCSPTTVARLSLPKIAAKLMPMESAQLYMAVRLLRPVRGEGLGCMSWREGTVDRLLIRISRDELRGTANLWSMLLL